MILMENKNDVLWLLSAFIQRFFIIQQHEQHEDGNGDLVPPTVVLCV